MEAQWDNKLEKSLRTAARDPARRSEFYRVLLESTVYVLGAAGAGEGRVNLEAGSELGIQCWERQDGVSAIPFFSSLEVLQKSIANEQTYLALPAKSFFEMAVGNHLVLNPKSPHGKEFAPEEVRRLLSGGDGQRPSRRTIKEETEVLLGQPARYPSKMADSLTQILAKHTNVKRAFLALMHDASVDEKPHLVVGIEADGDIEGIFREAGAVAADTAPNGEPVDLCRVSVDEAGLSDYLLNQTKPFYERRSGTKSL